MKKMKKLVTVIIVMVAATVIIQSCKKNSSTADYNADKSKLSLQIDSATTLYSSAVEGKQAGDYTTGSKAVLETAINLAISVKTGTTFTQQDVNNATSNLQRAEVAFKTNLIQQISAANLVAYWKFSGNANDSSGNGHNGTLKTGWIGASATSYSDGGTLPTLTADRYGNANSAYYFNNGAQIDVPYSTDLRPTSFTISAWIKPAVESAGNYIISLDRWNGYKFQIQSNNFPYLTVMTSGGDLDVDDNPGSVTTNVWSQVAVTYTSGTMIFYINGVLTKTVTISGTPTALSNPPDLSIGDEMPESGYNFTDSNSPNYFYGASFFMGAIDDVRLYNTVLSATEINSLYVMESPN
jgi:hypothetical protein